jgi:hypothetical protein
MKIKKCPLCNYSNSYNAMFCKCGYDLSTIMPTEENNKKTSFNLDDLFSEQIANSEKTCTEKNQVHEAKAFISRDENSSDRASKFLFSDIKKAENKIERRNIVERQYKVERQNNVARKKFFLRELTSDLLFEVKNATVIGRQSDNNLIVENLKNKSAVSRKHAELSIENNSIYIKDLNSKNGTFVNDKKISHGEKIELKNNDLICLGSVQSKFNKELMALYRLEEK